MYNKNVKIKMKKETIWKVIVVISSILLVLTSIAPLFFLR